MNQELLSQIISLSKELIRIPSTADNQYSLYQVLEVAKNALSQFTPEAFESKGKPSVLISNRSGGKKHFKIILNAHLDVVPGHKEQFVPYEKNGKLFGRGAYDMKTAAATFIVLFKTLAKELPYPLALQLTTDEELGGYDGTGYQILQGVTTNFFIMGEPTWLKLNNAAKGVLWMKLTATGESNHAAYPWLGHNAITRMERAAHAIASQYPIPSSDTWQTTATQTRIETTNNTTNMIPEFCTSYFDVRYVPTERNIIENMKQILPSDIALEVTMFDHAFYTPENNPYLQKLRSLGEEILGHKPEYLSSNGSSDARHYEGINTRGVCFGPLGEGHHSDNEYVEIKSLEDYYHILKDFLLSASDL